MERPPRYPRNPAIDIFIQNSHHDPMKIVLKLAPLTPGSAARISEARCGSDVEAPDLGQIPDIALLIRATSLPARTRAFHPAIS
jgi:hypothetical protein